MNVSCRQFSSSPLPFFCYFLLMVLLLSPLIFGKPREHGPPSGLPLRCTNAHACPFMDLSTLYTRDIFVRVVCVCINRTIHCSPSLGNVILVSIFISCFKPKGRVFFSNLITLAVHLGLRRCDTGERRKDRTEASSRLRCSKMACCRSPPRRCACTPGAVCRAQPCSGW